jgi:predicted dehydrogenase
MISAWVYQDWVPYARGKWRGDPVQAGGGQSYDSGAHLFNSVLYLTGLEPVRVYCATDNRDLDVDVCASAVIHLTEGVQASVAVSGCSRSMHEGIHFSGTGGTMQVGIYGGPVRVWDESGGPRDPDLPQCPTIHENFMACIRGEASPPSTAEQGLKLSLFMEALYRSAQSGEAVAVCEQP